jgi:hypothetical protein
MKTTMAAFALASLITASVAAKAAEPPALAPSATSATQKLSVARISADGKLQKPVDLVNWVFLGTSLGMGYNPGSFNASRPGQFQVVLMEPNAYKHFIATGRYAPGSMFLLSFYDTETQQRSINQNGFTQAGLTNYEIHLIGPGKGEAAHTFYMFDAKSTEGRPLPPGNACVRCHIDHGAFQGTFAQFYPTIRPLIPKEALERAARDTIR